MGSAPLDAKALRQLNQETAVALSAEASHLKVIAMLGPEKVDRLEQMMDNLMELGYGIQVFRSMGGEDIMRVRKVDGDDAEIRGDGSRSLQQLLGEASSQLESALLRREQELRQIMESNG